MNSFNLIYFIFQLKATFLVANNQQIQSELEHAQNSGRIPLKLLQRSFRKSRVWSKKLKCRTKFRKVKLKSVLSFHLAYQIE